MCARRIAISGAMLPSLSVIPAKPAAYAVDAANPALLLCANHSAQVREERQEEHNRDERHTPERVVAGAEEEPYRVEDPTRSAESWKRSIGHSSTFRRCRVEPTPARSLRRRPPRPSAVFRAVDCAGDSVAPAVTHSPRRSTCELMRLVRPGVAFLHALRAWLNRWGDPIIAVGFTLWIENDLWVQPPAGLTVSGGRGVAAVVLALITLPLAWRRRKPLACSSRSRVRCS